MENKDLTRERTDAQELTYQLEALHTLDTTTHHAFVACIEAFLTSRSLDAALRFAQDDVEAQNSSVIDAIKYAISFLPTDRPVPEPKDIAYGRTSEGRCMLCGKNQLNVKYTRRT